MESIEQARDALLGVLIGLSHACTNNPKTQNTDRIYHRWSAVLGTRNRYTDNPSTDKKDIGGKKYRCAGLCILSGTLRQYG